MSGIASKNLYDLLGNDPELDPDRVPAPPTKAVDKTSQRSGKRNAGPEAPSSDNARSRGGRGGGRDGYTGSEQAFRDRGAGSFQNRSRAPDDGLRRDRVRDPAEHREGGGRGRGSRGGRGYGGRGPRPARDDRHSKTGVTDHEKQVAHGWGGNDGESEWNDEKAGEAIAKAEEKEGADASAAANADGETTDAAGNQPEPEPEDTTKSYDAYLEELAQKKLSLGPVHEPRKPEQAGKKGPQGKAIEHNDEEETYFVGGGGKNKRTKERKEKTRLDLDDSRMYAEPDRNSSGRGRGGRGGRGGEGGFRGEGRGRGRGGRGGERGGFRGGERGGRGGRGGPTPNVADTNAFPSLGS